MTRRSYSMQRELTFEVYPKIRMIELGSPAPQDVPQNVPQDGRDGDLEGEPGVSFTEPDASHLEGTSREMRDGEYEGKPDISFTRSKASHLEDASREGVTRNLMAKLKH